MRAFFKNPTKGHLAIHDTGGNLIVKLLPNQTFDLTPYIGEVNSMQQLLERVVVNNHIDSIFHNQLRGKKYSNLSPTDYFYLQANVAPIISGKLEITFNNIINSPVIPATSLIGWNNFFDTEDFADVPFSAVEVIGNKVKFTGPNSLIIKAYLFYENTSVVSVSDDHCVSEIGDAAFYACPITQVILSSVTNISGAAFEECPNLTTASFAAAETVGLGAFGLCTNLNTISLPSVSTMDTYVFHTITGKIITLTIPQTLLASSNSSIMALTGNNTVTIIAV